MTDETPRRRPRVTTTKLRRVVRRKPDKTAAARHPHARRREPVPAPDAGDATIDTPPPAPLRQDTPDVLASELEPALAERFGPLARLSTSADDRLYVALDRRSSRIAALRVARPGTPGGRLVEHEIRLLGRIAHMNVVAMVGHGVAGSQRWIACQYLEGASLRRRLDSGPRPPREAALIVAQVLDGLAAMHAAGWVHRDLTPERVKDSGTGLYKILGFARALPPGEAPLHDCKPSDLRYLAPEALWGVRQGPPGDVYSAGALLYELLTGVPPFLAANEAQLIEEITTEDPVPPGQRAAMPADFDELVLRALAKEPGERFAEAEEMSDALRALAR